MVDISGLCLEFRDESGKTLRVLDEVNLNLPSRGLAFLLGKSGSGKTSLLHCLGGFTAPTKGSISVLGKPIDFKDQEALSKYRRSMVSFVFQDFNLLSDFSVLENLFISGCPEEACSRLLKQVGLEGKEKTKVRLLSGGEQQRLAIGRALAKNSPLFLLDEPTANLDQGNAEAIFALLKEIARDRLVLVATHDSESAYALGDEVFEIRAGKIVQDEEAGSSGTLFDPFSVQSDAFIAFCAKVTENKIHRVFLSCEEEKKNMDVSSNVYATLSKELAPYEGKPLRISFAKAEEKEGGEPPLPSGNEPSFPFKKQLTYAGRIWKRHPGRSIATVIATSLTALMISAQSSVVFFDESAASVRCFDASQMILAPLARKVYNDYLGTEHYTSSGKDFYESILDTTGEAPIVAHRAEAGSYQDKDLQEDVRVYVLENPLPLKGQTLEPPALGQAYCSNFLSEILFGGEVGINFPLNRDGFQKELYVLDHPYGYASSELIKHFEAGKCSDEERDWISTTGLSLIISRETFDSFFTIFDAPPLCGPSLKEDGVGMSNTVFLDAESMDGTSKNYEIKAGRLPQADNEIAVCKNYFEEVLKVEDPSLSSLEDLVGKTLYFPNLKALPNALKYESMVNPRDIGKEFTVTGVVDSSTTYHFFCVVNDATSRKIYSFSFYNGDSVSIRVDNAEKMKRLFEAGFLVQTDSEARLQDISTFLLHEVNMVCWIIEAILGLICLLLLCFSGDVCVRQKWKEICILDSLGVKKRQIRAPFYWLNASQILLGLLIGLTLTFPALFGTNAALKTSSWLKLNYDLFLFAPLSLPILVGLGILAFLLSTITPLRRIREKNLSISLRSLG